MEEVERDVAKMSLSDRYITKPLPELNGETVHPAFESHVFSQKEWQAYTRYGMVLIHSFC